MDARLFSGVVRELIREIFVKKSNKEIVSCYIKIVSKEVDAVSGAVYLKDDDFLKIGGSYAFSSEDVKFKVGEGIVGEVALSLEAVELKGVKNLEIKSASKLFAEGSLYVFPVSFAGELFGVVEVIKGAEFSKYQKNLLDASSEILALALLNNQRVNQIKEQYGQIERQNEELKRQKREIELQNGIISKEVNKLKVSNKYKSEFLANMSHELRTPLNSIIILSRLLGSNRDKNLSKTQVKHLNIIHKSANDLLDLINDILDLSKVEARLMSVNLQRFNIKDLLLELYDNFLPIANNKGLELKLELKDLREVEVFSDSKKIKQILKNLLSNALKFTKDGFVLIGFKEYDSSFELFVKDSGIGIEKKNFEKIFEPFKQADGGTDRKYGGTGLGLSISKEFANLLGGKLWVESEVGVGSCFFLQLPKEIDPARLKGADIEIVDTKEGRVRSTKEQKEILVITDSKSLRLQIERGFSDLNFNLLFSSADSEIFSKLDKKFDVIIIGIDFRKKGLELIRRVKFYSKETPIIVYSSMEFSSQEVLFLRRFSSEIVMQSKESIHRLKEVILLLTNREKREEKDENFDYLRDKYALLKGTKVLVVDDDSVNLFSISMLLDEIGLKAVVAENGDECLKRLKKESVDIILMDLMMPKKDGIETIKEIKQIDEFKNIPIIVLTAKRDDEDKKRAYAVGADGFLSKPVDHERLFELIKRLVVGSE